MKKTAAHYKKNKASYKKKLAYDKKYNARPDKKKYRRELAVERRRRGMMGKGGSDVSHKKGGGYTMENASKNRARNGSKMGRKKSAPRIGTKK
jgi:hypothetical protein